MLAESSALPQFEDGLDVLLLEDSPSDAWLVKEQLNSYGSSIRLTTVTHLADGLRSIQQKKFHAALVDLNLPDSLGIDTFERLHAAVPNLPLIVLSGIDDAQLTINILRKGAQDCLLKREALGALLYKAIQFAVERHRLNVEFEERVADLNRIETRIRSIIENSRDAFVVVDVDGCVTFANAAAASMLDTTIPALRANRLELPYLSDGTAEVKIRRRDGDDGIAELRSIGRNLGEVQDGNLFSLHDITDRKKTEEAIRNSKHRMRALLEQSTDGIFVADSAGKLSFLSPSIQHLTGYSLGELIGTDLILYAHPDDAVRLRELRSTLVAHPNRSIAIEWRFQRKNGTWLCLDAVSTNRLDDAAVRGIVTNFRDITERKRTQEAERQSQKMEALGTLAGGIAHDFNNILLAISGNTKLAIDDLPVDHPVRESLLEVEKASSRAIGLVRRILAFSRHDLPQPAPTDLAEVLKEAVQLLRPMLSASIDIHIDIAPEVSRVVADSMQIHQIIMNLVANSAYAIGDRQGHIKILLEDLWVSDNLASSCAWLREGRYVCISLSDDGCGIEQSDLERIFEPFFTSKPKGEGTGLGLSVVHGIMRAHDGAIRVVSEPNRGSTFHLYFPAAIPTSAFVPDVQPDIEHGGGERVMYVDDEDSLVFLVTRALERIGYCVHGFTDARLALESLRTAPDAFDIVVTDLSMPGMSGFQFAAKVRELLPSMPIITTTGYVREEDREAARQLGILEVILKPDTIDRLSATLHSHIRGARIVNR